MLIFESSAPERIQAKKGTLPYYYYVSRLLIAVLNLFSPSLELSSAQNCKGLWSNGLETEFNLQFGKWLASSNSMKNIGQSATTDVRNSRRPQIRWWQFKKYLNNTILIGLVAFTQFGILSYTKIALEILTGFSPTTFCTHFRMYHEN